MRKMRKEDVRREPGTIERLFRTRDTKIVQKVVSMFGDEQQKSKEKHARS